MLIKAPFHLITAFILPVISGAHRSADAISEMRCFTVIDASSSGVLTGFGISGELCPCGGDQAVVSQLLYPQVPGGAAIYPVVPRGHPLIVVFSGAVCGEDERLRRGSDA